LAVMTVNLTGCVAVGVAVLGAAAVGGYAVSKDTIQGETDKYYDTLWESALSVARIRGTVKKEDSMSGYIELQADSSKVYIHLIRLTQATTRLKVQARKYHLPNISLAQEIYLKIVEQAR
jgi:hypothetical protein